MKKYFPFLLVAGALALAGGCSKIEAPKAETESAAPVDPAAVVENLKTSAADLTAKLMEQAKAAADTQLASLANELGGKVRVLGTTTEPNSDIRSDLGNILTSLTTGQDASALTNVLSLINTPKLTPEQTALAKDIGNLVSAYVVEKNFSGWESGPQSNVATVVNALRNGQIAAAIPALKNLAADARLTDEQKQVIIPLADKYAPGWQKLQGAVDVLKKIPGFGN